MATEDEDLPIGRKAPLKDLTPLSLAELDAYVAELEAEITRVKAAAEAKRRHRSGVESLFKPPPG
jgi:uncharacterized small protein (DUF1192 family)